MYAFLMCSSITPHPLPNRTPSPPTILQWLSSVNSQLYPFLPDCLLLWMSLSSQSQHTSARCTIVASTNMTSTSSRDNLTDKIVYPISTALQPSINATYEFRWVWHSLIVFFSAASPAATGEHWALPDTFRMSLIENLKKIIQQNKNQIFYTTYGVPLLWIILLI